MCRVCGTRLPKPYFDLGRQPFANALRSPDDDSPEYTVPLAITACPQCHLSQLTYVANPELLYSTYVYRSGYSAAWRAHCSALAERFTTHRTVPEFVLEIASNDGTMLNEFAKRGSQVHGVEPASEFASCGYPITTAFWTSELARDKFAGEADILLATNVLGHVNNVHDFMAGVAAALTARGGAIIEVPYVVDLLANCAFDTIYHEHLSYWSVTALKALCEHHNLVLIDVERLAVHGGAIRAIIRKLNYNDPPSGKVDELVDDEARKLRPATYEAFSYRTSARIARIQSHLQDIPYVGFGAAAKATVMLGALDVRTTPRVVYDDTPGKHGKLIPGTRVAIQAPPRKWSSVVHPLALFAWNWADSIVPRLRAAGLRAPIFVPLPKPRWLTA